MRNDVSGRGMLAAILGLVLLAGTAWADPPRVTKSKPANGATEVPRDVGVLLVFFDRNMKLNQWTLWTSEEGEFPPLAAPDENPWRDPRTLELKLEALKPGTTYALQLNSAKAKKQGFRSAEGDEPLPDTVITFTTNTVGLAPDSAPPGPGPAPDPAPKPEPTPAPELIPTPAAGPPTAASLAGEWQSDGMSADMWFLTLAEDGTFELRALQVVNEEVKHPTWKGTFEVSKSGGGMDLRVDGKFFEHLSYRKEGETESLGGILSGQIVTLIRKGKEAPPAPAPAPDPAPTPAPKPTLFGPKPGPKPSPFLPRPAVSPLVGTWVDESGAVTVVMKADGTFTRTMRTEAGEDQATGTWAAKDGVMEVKTAGSDETLRIRYEMPDKDTIVLTDDEGSSDRMHRAGTVGPGPGPGPGPLPPASPLVGTWFAEDPTGSMRLGLRADGTHTSVFATPQGRRETTGTWTAQGGTLTIRLVEVNQVLSWPFTQPDRDTIQVTLPGGIVVALKRQ